jgi:uncharacterized protein (DUF2236 family)
MRLSENETRAETAGLFPPDSMMRQITQEALTLLGGGRAILLQLAHPLIAAGVADHSQFQTDPLTRLLRTLELMHTIIFGSRSQARTALARFHAIHEQIKGQLPDTVGRYPPATTYHGNDPHLKLWVAATLIDTSLSAYQQFVQELTQAEQERYYADALTLAQLMDISHEVFPPNLQAFWHYMEEMLAGDTLAVTDTTRRLAWEVLAPGNVGLFSVVSARMLRFTTAGLLPPHLRQAYQLTWSQRQQGQLTFLSQTTRGLRPYMPRWVWQSPLLDGRLAQYTVIANLLAPANATGQ